MAYKHAPTYNELQEMRRLIPGKLPFTPLQIASLVLGGLCLLATLGLLWYEWPEIAAIIPTHYGFDGQPDAWGSKNSLLPLAALDILLYLGLVILIFFPKVWNVPYPFTAETVVWTYQQLRSMLCLMVLAISLGFGYIIYASYHLNKLPVWFLVLFLAAIFIPLIYYWRRLKKRLA